MDPETPDILRRRPPTPAEVRAEFARPCPCFQRMRGPRLTERTGKLLMDAPVRSVAPRVDGSRVYDDRGNCYPSAAAAGRSLGMAPDGGAIKAALAYRVPTAAGRRWTRDPLVARRWK